MILFETSPILGQEQVDNTFAYQWFDEIIGQTNTGIFKGVAYTEQYRVINGKHHFFKHPNFVLGTVVYDGQPYYKIRLRYNVYEDQLNVQKEQSGRIPALVLDSENILEFFIGPHRFKSMGLTDTNGKVSGFFEVLWEKDSLVLLKKHRKKRFKRTDEKVLYYEFKDDASHHLYNGTGFYTLNKAKDLLGIFPENTNQLKAILRRHGSAKKRDTDEYWKAVLMDFQKLLSSHIDSNP